MGFLEIARPGRCEIEVKNSRFLGEACAVFSEEEAAEKIAALRKEHYDARHVCSAYIIRNSSGGAALMRASDDGEPQGTAGRPILSVIEGSGLQNCLITVIRYFGGTLLGTGGLVRAYTQAAQEAVAAAALSEMTCCAVLSVSMDYGLYNPVKYYIGEQSLRVDSEDFSDKVCLTLVVRKEMEEQIRSDLMELTAGRIAMDTLSYGDYAV
ncbi:MAG: YigZ family protein [Lachnospiraceae bacterium]|nr:YigZ family protein [Lachnospiraceae bacterium]